jgi:hypothetical protein
MGLDEIQSVKEHQLRLSRVTGTPAIFDMKFSVSDGKQESVDFCGMADDCVQFAA